MAQLDGIFKLASFYLRRRNTNKPGEDSKPVLPEGAIPVHSPAALGKCCHQCGSVGGHFRWVNQRLYIKMIREVGAQAPEEHTQPRDTVQVKCNQCWSGFLVCLSSWSNGFDKRLSHNFWVCCQEGFVQIKLPLALVPLH